MEKDKEFKEFLVFSWAYYDQLVWYARHYFPTALTKNGRVLYCEKEPSIISFIKYKEEISRLLSSHHKTREVGENLYVYSPLPRIPLDRCISAINRINKKKLASEIRRELKKLFFHDITIVTFDFMAAPLISTIPHKASVYYCVDEILGYGMDISSQKVIDVAEKELVSKVDLTIVVSDHLYEKHLPYARNIMKITHGIDLELFTKKLDSNDLKELSGLQKPLVGFIGKISKNPLDVILIKRILSERRNYQFVFVGPEYDGIVEELSYYKNFYYVPTVPKEKVASFIRAFDVCIIPYKMNSYVKGMNSIKTIQYLSQGKPVVSTNIPEAKKLVPMIKVANSAEHFILLLDEAVSDTDVFMAQKRVEFAQSQSWEVKVQEFVNKLSELSNDKKNS
ncbi:MAG: glycosyltransferase [Bacteroidetes bacterium]|nr:glycosyltransferase [Bacteroidota bacterium]